MLDKMRKPGRTKNIISYVFFSMFFVIMVIVFVFFGANQTQMGSGAGGAAAVVGNRVISVSQYQEAYRRLENMYARNLDGLPAAERNRMYGDIRRDALEGLIDSEILAQAAHAEGIVVSTAEVQNYIKSIPSFQDKGRFNYERYDNYLKYARTTAREFEQEIRKDVALNRIRDMFMSAVQASDLEKQRSKELEGIELNLSYLELSREASLPNLVVSEKDVENFRDTQKDKITAYYSQNKDKYSTDEQVKARHILIKAEGGGDPAFAQALTKIKDVKGRLDKGEDFAVVAKEVSEDPGSKDSGGDLGFFGRGRMVKEFEEAAFSLSPSAISEPIKTTYGYHLIQVQEKKPASTRKVEDVELEIARELVRDSKWEEVEKEFAEALKSGKTDQVDKLAKSMKLTWKDTGPFNLAAGRIPGLGDGSELLAKALVGARPGYMVPELVSHLGQNYIVKVKTFKQDPLKKGDDSDNMAFARVGDVFMRWQSKVKAQAKVERNERLTTVQ